jgi:hypothetical protein
MTDASHFNQASYCQRPSPTSASKMRARGNAFLGRGTAVGAIFIAACPDTCSGLTLALRKRLSRRGLERMRVTALIILAMVLSSGAAHAQDDTRDLPSPSDTRRSSPPPESDTPRERARINRPRHAACSAEWVCGRVRFRANDNYPLGSSLYGLQARGRWIDGPCRKVKRC